MRGFTARMGLYDKASPEGPQVAPPKVDTSLIRVTRAHAW